MRNYLLAIVLLAVSYAHAWAIEHVDVKATYKVEEETFEEGWVKVRLWRESWRVKGIVDLEEDPNYTREAKEASLPRYSKNISREKESSLKRKVYKQDSYTEYFWHVHPNMLEVAGKTIGRIERKQKEKGDVIARWPLFITSKRISPFLLETVHTVFAEGGNILRTTEIHSKSGYHLPVEKVVEMFNLHGGLLGRTKYQQVD